MTEREYFVKARLGKILELAEILHDPMSDEYAAHSSQPFRNWRGA